MASVAAAHAVDPSDKKALPLPALTVEEALALPALNGPETICRLWDISHSWFCKLSKQGAFDFLKATPAVGPRCFSGVLIARYLCKEPLYVPTFGGRRK